MKRFLLIAFLASFMFTQSGYSCGHPPQDSVIQLIVNYDTIWDNTCLYADHIEIRITNMRVMDESPNRICACAFGDFSSTFSNLTYIAFVDSATNNPYDGFAGFQIEPEASSKWNTQQPGHGGWAGLIADVINGGLEADDPIEMIIRATAPAGTMISIDSGCSPTNVLENMINNTHAGFDAWDPILEDLDQSHQSVLSLNTNPSTATLVLNEKSHQYFVNLDNDILNNIPSDTNVCNAAFSSYFWDSVTVTFVDLSNSKALQYVIWDFGDGTTVKSYPESSEGHIYADTGLYEVCLYNINNDDTVCQICQTLQIADSADSVDGVSVVSSQMNLSVYPNPAKDMLHVTYEGSNIEGFNIELITLLGTQVELAALNANGSIDVSQVPAGMYFVRAYNDNSDDMVSDMVIIRH